jgi:type IV pilus assembly protein PilF
VKPRFAPLWPVVFALFIAGCASTAERNAEQARKQRFIDTYIELGAGYLQRGQLDIARDNFKKALDLDSDHPQANNMMALLHWRLKNYGEAERHFQKAIAGGETNPEAWNNYGVFQCERGHFDEAVKWFEKAAAVPLNKNSAGAYENAGLCLMKKPAPVAAEKYFRQALEVDPKSSKSLYRLAKISYDRGKTMSARGFMQRYFEASADTPETLLLAIRIERALRNKDAEASYAVRLKGKFPNSPEAKQLAQLLRSPRRK